MLLRANSNTQVIERKQCSIEQRRQLKLYPARMGSNTKQSEETVLVKERERTVFYKGNRTNTILKCKQKHIKINRTKSAIHFTLKCF